MFEPTQKPYKIVALLMTREVECSLATLDLNNIRALAPTAGSRSMT